MQPLEVQDCTVPHFKDLMSDYYEASSQGRGSSFKVCYAHFKNAILLHSSLVAGVSFFPQVYIVHVCFRLMHRSLDYFPLQYVVRLKRLQIPLKEQSAHKDILIHGWFSLRGHSQTTFTAMGGGGFVKCQLY